MDENNPVNQGGEEERKLQKLESELGELEKKAAAPQSTPPPSPPAEPMPSPTPPESTPPTTGKSKVVVWVGLGLLLLSLVGLGAYYIVSRKAVSVPTSTPSPATLLTSTPEPTTNWKTYRSNELSIEFKYPADWSVQTEPLTLSDPTGALTISIVSVDRTIIGASYCEINPQDVSRCEKVVTKNSPAVVDWGENLTIQANAIVGLTVKRGLSIALSGTIDSETKNLFRMLLSTFKFIEAAPEASPSGTPSATMNP